MINQSLLNQETIYHPDQDLSINLVGFKNICMLFLSFQPLLSRKRKVREVSHPDKDPQFFLCIINFLIFVDLRRN